MIQIALTLYRTRKPRCACLCLIAFLLQAVALPAVVTEVASLRGFLYGNEPNCAYDNWVSHLAEGRVSNLNVYATWEVQNNDFGDFLIPSLEQLVQWDAVMVDFLSLNLQAAQQKLDHYGFPFEVVQFQDLDSGRNLYLIRELLNNHIDDNGTPEPEDDEIGSFDFGWGLYIYNPWASRPIIISAPHPCDDYPSPPFALEAFHTLDARFLMIAGAGREVAYNSPYNSNNQSISDPSRYLEHPFNYAYHQFADQIRALTGRTEFSLQIHTYDWNKYPTDRNVMLSAGNGRYYPALPIRDNSRVRHDLINLSPYLIHPAGTIGDNSEVTVSQYYSVYHSTDYRIRYQSEGHDIAISVNNNLPGAEYNQQMLYTEQPNLYDVYSPFLHVEMDELPSSYTQTTANWKWFYGYDEATQTWDADQRYTRFIDYYTPWLTALNAVIDAMLDLDDNCAPSNPSNLAVASLSTTTMSITWDRSYSYDFDSYEIHYRYEQNEVMIYRVLDRHDYPELAWQALGSHSFQVDAGNSIYYIRVRARDKHGNHSAYSKELKVFKMGNALSGFSVNSGDNQISLVFTSSLTSILGFNIYRAVGQGDFHLLASWFTNPALQVNANGSYGFTDNHVVNGIIYRYQISAEYQSGFEHYDWRIRTASPFAVYAVRLLHLGENLADSLMIGINPLAADGTDSFDLYTVGSAPSFVLTSDLSSTWYNYYQDIKAAYDQSSGSKMWLLKYRVPSAPALLQLQLSPALVQAGFDLMLYDRQSLDWHDLNAGNYQFVCAATGWQYLELHWGYQPPLVLIGEMENGFGFGGDPVAFGWQILNSGRVTGVNLHLISPRDSLLVVDGLPAESGQYTWTPPIPFTNAFLRIEAVCQDGNNAIALSNWRLNVVPPMLTYQQPAGYSLLSVPLEGFDQNLASLLGSQALGWHFDGAVGWQPSPNFTASIANLVWHPLAFQLSLSAELPATAQNFPLVWGWNALPNPHWHHYELKDLLFNQAGVTKTYAQMVSQGSLPPRIYLYRSQGFIPADHLPPQQAFLLQYLDTQPCSVVFDPTLNSGPPIPWQTNWQIGISLSDGFLSPDAIQLGICETGSEAFDPLYDLPKAPDFPLQPWRLALLQVDAQSGYERELQCEFKGLFPHYNPVEKVWQFRLQNSDLRWLRFALELEELPADHSVELQFGDQSVVFTGSGVMWVHPATIGVHTGYLRVRNHLPTHLLHPVTASAGQESGDQDFALRLQPDPFRSELRIRLNTKANQPLCVEIYNLKGERVIRLFQGLSKEGETQLVWDGRDATGRSVAAGIYLLKATLAGQVYQHKLMRLK